MRAARIICAWVARGADVRSARRAPRRLARHRVVTPPRAALGAIACRQAVEPAPAGGLGAATMRPLAATRSLQIKFALSVTAAPHSAPPRSSRRDLGQWLTPTRSDARAAAGRHLEAVDRRSTTSGRAATGTRSRSAGWARRTGCSGPSRATARAARSRSFAPIWRSRSVRVTSDRRRARSRQVRGRDRQPGPQRLGTVLGRCSSPAPRAPVADEAGPHRCRGQAPRRPIHRAACDAAAPPTWSPTPPGTSTTRSAPTTR